MVLKIDRRGTGRIRLKLPITYANLSARQTGSYRYYKTAVGDLSKRGLGITLDEPALKHDLLQVVLSIPIEPFVITGLVKVVWSNRLAGGSQFRAGLHFINLAPEHGAAMAALIR